MASPEAPSAPTNGARAMPQPGDTIDRKYALIRVLGTGGMGVVYEAEHIRLKQRCAIKMLSPEMLREAEIIHRFEREARASALLKSPHVTRVTDVATTSDGVPYIVMELLVGHDLDGELQARGHVPYPLAVDYVLQACAAVAEAHAAGIIHRDLKPGNLFLAEEPDGLMVKVLDFGISKMTEDESKLTSAGMTMGTALYMSPEQLRSAATVDARSDIWSIGVILYELLCGKTPFTGSVTQIAAAIVSVDAPDLAARCAIPPELSRIVHRMLRRSPAERFATVADLMSALVPFAPQESLGVAVAAQVLRRGSARQLPAVSLPPSDPHFATHDEASSRTMAHEARDVASSVSHPIRTSARHDSSARKLLIAALAVVAVVVTAGAVVVGVVLFRRPPGIGAHGPAVAVATASAVASEAPAAASEAPVASAMAAAPAEPPGATTAPSGAPADEKPAPAPPKATATARATATTTTTPTARRATTATATATARPTATATAPPPFL